MCTSWATHSIPITQTCSWGQSHLIWAVMGLCFLGGCQAIWIPTHGKSWQSGMDEASPQSSPTSSHPIRPGLWGRRDSCLLCTRVQKGWGTSARGVRDLSENPEVCGGGKDVVSLPVQTNTAQNNNFVSWWRPWKVPEVSWAFLEYKYGRIQVW